MRSRRHRASLDVRSEIDGKKCLAPLQDVQPPVDGALLMTSPAVSDRVVEECARAGIGRVWMYRFSGNPKIRIQPIQITTLERSTQLWQLNSPRCMTASWSV